MMFSRKKSKTISRLEQAQSRVIELKLLAYKWDDYNFTSHESYQEPMKKFCQHIVSLTGSKISVNELQYYFSNIDFERVKVTLDYIDLLISELKEQPESIVLDQDFFELLDFSLLCNFYTGYDGGIIAYSRFSIDFNASTGIIETFELLTDSEGKFKTNIITEDEFNKNQWLFEAFTSETDIQYEDYLALFDIPVPTELYSDRTQDNEITTSIVTKSVDINAEIQVLSSITSGSLKSLERTLATLEFVSQNNQKIIRGLGLSSSDPTVNQIALFRDEFHQILRDLSVGIPTSTSNLESILMSARNIELEYKNKFPDDL